MSAQDFHAAIVALAREATDTWMPPPSDDDDPSADWREVTPEQFLAYRARRDRDLTARFAALLEAEREALLRRMAASASDPGDVRPLH